MDYSLVVGVDSDRQELVVGIVDYIRTFTWCADCRNVGWKLTNRDKKLESWVKDSTFLGGAGKGEPTIVTPKQCKTSLASAVEPTDIIDKTRFRTAMDKFYFPSVPDRWSKKGQEENPVEEETNAGTI